MVSALLSTTSSNSEIWAWRCLPHPDRESHFNRPQCGMFLWLQLASVVGQFSPPTKC